MSKGILAVVLLVDEGGERELEGAGRGTRALADRLVKCGSKNRDPRFSPMLREMNAASTVFVEP